MKAYIQDGRRRVGWWWSYNEVFDVGLSPSAFLVYCYLCRIADNSSSVASISYRKLAKKLKMSVQTVFKAIEELVEKGLVIKEPRIGEKGNRMTNLYRLTSVEEWDLDGTEKEETKEKEVSSKNEKSTNLEKLLEEAKAWNLTRLSPEQAVFFLLNSPMDRRIIEKEIRKADASPRIRNPVGYLIDTFQVDAKKAIHRELLLVEAEEAEEDTDGTEGYDWRKLWERKVQKLRAVAEKYGIDIPEPKSEEEAHEILRRIQRIVAEKAEIPEEAWKKARELAKGNRDMEVSFALSFAGIDTSLFSLTTL